MLNQTQSQAAIKFERSYEASVEELWELGPRRRGWRLGGGLEVFPLRCETWT